jgi:hypothetical protein
MPDYSLVPVDYQPDFDDYSLVPVDHDPFAEDGATQQAQIQQAQAQPQGPPRQQPATGAGQPDAGAPTAGGGIGRTGGAPNPTLDQGAAKAAPFGGYSLVPVDYQPDFDGYSPVPVDYDPFSADGPIQQARTQLASQPQPDAGFDQPPSAPQTPGSAPPLPPIVPNDGQAPSVPQPPGQDLHWQYQALRPMLGDRNAMLATVYPEVRQTLIAQALAGRQQPGQTSEPAPTGGVSGVTQQAQTQAQPAQPQPQTQPQQPATGAGQPDAGAPAAGDGPSGSGGVGIGPIGGAPNPASDQVGAEPAPFGGYANPTPTESLVNKARMDDLAAEIDADLTGRRGSDFEGGKAKSYRFVTTKPALDPHQIGEAGITFIAISPFHANDGARTAIIDASPEHPLRVTVTDDGKLTLSPP